MAKKKRKNALDRWFDRQLDMADRKPEDSILYRMAYSSAVSAALRETHPVLFWCLVICLLTGFLLPMVLYTLALERSGHGSTSGWQTLPAMLGFFSALLSGIGLFNLMMLPAQMICARCLREDFPNGFIAPFYLGHKVTLIFLAGCGGLSALCIACIHLL